MKNRYYKYNPVYITVKNNDCQKFLKILLKHTDVICFTVLPYLDSIEELKQETLYMHLYKSIIGTEYVESINTEKEKDSVLYLKVDYNVIKFLQNRTGIFDFYNEELSINLWNPVFLKNGEIICETVTHECLCSVSQEIYEEM